MIVLFTALWAIMIYCAAHMPPADMPILILPAIPLLAATGIYISGCARFQEDRDQLDSVLDMFSYPDKWVSLKDKSGWKIPDRAMVWVHMGVLYVIVQVGNDLTRWQPKRAYAAKFQRKLELLQDWHQMQALVGHFKELEK